MTSRTIFHVNMPKSPENHHTPNDLATTNIERIAINHRGFIGSLYDVYKDNIGEPLDINFKSQLYQSGKQTKSKFIKGRTPDSQNLLKFVDIDYQLRLSIELEIVPASGIALLINYSQLLDGHTRLLYVYQEFCTHSCRDSLHKMKKTLTPLFETSATHIITEVIWGIHLLVILQLPPEQEEDIDIVLYKIHQNLSNNNNTLHIEALDKAQLDRIICTTVYSNIPDLTKIEKLEDVYHRIIELQKNTSQHQPLKYVLTPIQWFNEECALINSTFILSKSDGIETLEYYLLQQSSELKVLNLRLNQDLVELLQGKFKKKLRNIQEELSKLQALHMKDFERLRDIVLNIRKGRNHQNYLDKEVNLDPPIEIQRLTKDIIIHIEQLESKGNLIKLLQNDRFEYCNVAKLGIRKGLKEEVVNDILFGNDFHKAIFFSTDEFRNNDKKTWNKLYFEMIDERKNNPQLSLVYADFTYSTYELKKMTITLSADMIENDNQSNSKPSKSNAKRKTPSPPPPLSTNEYINILLLGESGVGKSTFINAFANYLRFPNLEEAQQGEPIVIIPVSYLMTINDNFDERVIKFGEADPNENHNNFGQSVTQQCRSYVFNLFAEKKLRIIDTPGFGDTRGDQQDNLNMEEIFSFLNNITYLNGVCLLFKPEIAQLNPYFRSCCIQLFDYFGENIRNHLVFCFTNARSTFFAPGNTRPLLNTFFESFYVKKIPFKKTNTFCFDSESFRYLVAIQNSIEFDPIERDEFEQSWLRSVAESKRFRNFLIDQPSYSKNSEWQSNREAQFQIKLMIRPMLEATRNLLRNMLLYKLNSSIKLYATHTERPTMICYSCHHNPEKFGQFWILPDYLHHSPNTCTSNEQKPTEYRLNYEFLSDSVNEQMDDLKKQLRFLYETCAKLSYFLMNNSPTLQDDLFLAGTDRMINEEQFICQTQTSTDSNKTLISGLGQFKTKYSEHLDKIKSNRDDLILSNIYDVIQLVNEIPMIKIQLDAIRKYQQVLVDNNQRIDDVNEIHKK